MSTLHSNETDFATSDLGITELASTSVESIGTSQHRDHAFEKSVFVCCVIYRVCIYLILLL